jgi:hypothetical protein
MLVFAWTLKMEATCSSETSVDSQRTTRRYILEDRTLVSKDFMTKSSRIVEMYGNIFMNEEQVGSHCLFEGHFPAFARTYVERHQKLSHSSRFPA